jgi:tRNA/rRNA methyltransferase
VRYEWNFAVVGAGTDKTKPRLAGGPAIVLVRPQLAVNVGMCARAMANFGLSDLRLVAPKEDWRGDGLSGERAMAAAAGAKDVLLAARPYDSVTAAIADLRHVWATTARERGQDKRIVPPHDAMTEAATHAVRGEAQGILFGPERTGLDNDEVALADAIITFPVNPAYASLNLAQAVLLVGYEWFGAAHAGALPFTEPERAPPAPREMVLSLFDYLEGELEQAGFFRPEGKGPVMRRNLRNILNRIGLTEQDVRTLRGAFVRLVEGPRTTVQTRKRERPK